MASSILPSFTWWILKAFSSFQTSMCLRQELRWVAQDTSIVIPTIRHKGHEAFQQEAYVACGRRFPGVFRGDHLTLSSQDFSFREVRIGSSFSCGDMGLDDLNVFSTYVYL